MAPNNSGTGGTAGGAADTERGASIARVTQLRLDGERALDAVTRERLPDDEAVQRLRDRVEQYANELVRQAKDPITIGVVGEFSVGKSMLLGTLLGQPDMLPVDERPTTGNVTALYLHPARPGDPTGLVGSAAVSYLSQQQLLDCVDFMLSELRAAVAEATPDVDQTPLLDYNPVRDGWDRLEAWAARNLWPPRPASPGNIGHRKIVDELLALRNAHLSARELLGAELAIEQVVVRSALDLGDTVGAPDEMPPRRIRPGLSRQDVATNGDDLRMTFPLIRRVSYRVAVDPQFWRLDGLRDQNAVVLLDFPGLTASRSAKRDEYLSRAEMHDVHTILVVFGSAKPGNDVPDRFYTMLQIPGREESELKNSILPVGNAFDLVNPPELGDGGEVTLDDLRAGSQRFSQLSYGTSDLVLKQDERIRLVSSIVAIGRQGYPMPTARHEAAKVREALRPALANADGWRKIAARMASAPPDGYWGEALAAFAEDGGFASLRTLIERHARQHGLTNKLRTMERYFIRLNKALGELERLLGPESPSANQAVAGRQLMAELADEFHKYHRRVVEGARQFRDPLAVTLPDQRPLLDAVRQYAVRQVFEWPEWQSILQRAEDGLIAKAVGEADDDEYGTSSLAYELEVEAAEGAETTGVFLHPYLKTCADVKEFARRSLGEAVAHFVDRWNEELTPLRERREEAAEQEVFRIGMNRLQAVRTGNREQALLLMTELDWVPKLLAGRKATPPEDDRRSFPLLEDHALPWHPLVPEPAEGNQQRTVRHQMYLFRLRRELARAVVDTATNGLSREINRFERGLQRDLSLLKSLIPNSRDLELMYPAVPDDDGGAGERDAEEEAAAGATESPIRNLLREWRAR